MKILVYSFMLRAMAIGIASVSTLLIKRCMTYKALHDKKSAYKALHNKDSAYKALHNKEPPYKTLTNKESIGLCKSVRLFSALYAK